MEIYEPRFVYHGFQYVEVTGFPGKPTLENLSGRVVHTDFPQVGPFECSNDLLNSFSKLRCGSYLSNFQAIPTDCPHREKNGWTGDAHLAADAGDVQLRQRGRLIPTGSRAWPIAVRQWICARYRARSEMDAERRAGVGIGLHPAAVVRCISTAATSAILEQHYGGWVKLMDRFAGRAKNNLLHYGLDDWVAIKKTPRREHRQQLLLSGRAGHGADRGACSRSLTMSSSTPSWPAMFTAYNTSYSTRAPACTPANTQTAQCTALYKGTHQDTTGSGCLTTSSSCWPTTTTIRTPACSAATFMPHVLSDFGKTDLALQMMTQPTGPG